MQNLTYILALSITVYAIFLVRNQTVSTDTIIASTVALVGFDVLLATIGVTIGSIAFLVGAMAFVWLFEGLRRPRVAMLRLPGGVVLGFGVMRQPVGVPA